jgi:hypothetical protein
MRMFSLVFLMAFGFLPFGHASRNMSSANKAYACNVTERTEATTRTLGTLQVVQGDSQINPPTLAITDKISLSCISSRSELWCSESMGGWIIAEANNFEPVVKMGFTFAYGDQNQNVVTVICN